jgi:Na+/proline symporter
LAYGVPPVVCLFLIGTFWSRANAQGSFAAICVGLVVAAGLFVVNEILALTSIHFLLVAPIVFGFCCVAMVAGSLLTAAPDAESISQYLWTPDTFRRETKELEATAWYSNYRIQALSIVVISVSLVIWLW